MILEVILLVIGFVLVIKGADFLVEGSSSLAKKLNISDLVIGLTIVSFGTSMPELIVSLISAYNGSTQIAIGNILGSNIANILLILGVTAVIYPVTVSKSTVLKEIPFSLLAVIVLAILANDFFFQSDAVFNGINMADGLIFLLFFAIFMYYVFEISRTKSFKDEEKKQEDEEEIVVMSNSKSSLFIVGGLIGLFLGGKWVVDSAVTIATSFGLSEAFIGLTIIAIGTSLPELVTSAVAALKKKADIAVGNVVGSNIFNIFWILGATSMVKSLPFSQENVLDVFAVILATLVLLLFMFTGKKNKLDRWEGVVMLALYLGYITYLVLNI